jgi:FKBP-type peptidyl-prolyl cis-trans isomerase SlpA
LRGLAYNGKLIDFLNGFFMSDSLTSALPTVTSSAYLTLHYRLAGQDGSPIISTFEGNPATLQLGGGQLSPLLENLLLGLPEGCERVFVLNDEPVFGPHNSDLLQRVARKVLEDNGEPGQVWQVGDVVDFTAPAGGRFAGMVCEIDDTGALFDFNHPLAGRALQFEVRIISIL